jgi:hypothetical protein
VLVAHATRPAPPLASVAPDVPRPLAQVIDRCLAKDPAQRYATGEDLAQALAAALEASPATAPGAPTPLPAVLSTSQAEAIWLRAAQLQMDAATAIRKGIKPATAAAAGGEGAPTDGYRVQDVEAAAAEVGIAREFVQLALAELPAQQGAVAEVSDADDAQITRVLGTDQRSIRVVRVIEAPAARVLEALGTVVQGHPYEFELLDTIGGHPLDGGVLSFKVPAAVVTTAGGINMFQYRMYQIEVFQCSVALHPLPGDRTEIVLTADLRPGARKNALWSRRIAYGLGGTGGGVGAVAALVLAAKGALAAGLLWASGGAAAALALAFGSFGLYRYSYRDALRESEKAFEELLAQVNTALRSQAVFGRALERRGPPGGAADDGMGGFLAGP